MACVCESIPSLVLQICDRQRYLAPNGYQNNGLWPTPSLTFETILDKSKDASEVCQNSVHSLWSLDAIVPNCRRRSAILPGPCHCHPRAVTFKHPSCFRYSCSLSYLFDYSFWVHTGSQTEFVFTNDRPDSKGGHEGHTVEENVTYTHSQKFIWIMSASILQRGMEPSYPPPMAFLSWSATCYLWGFNVQRSTPGLSSGRVS